LCLFAIFQNASWGISVPNTQYANIAPLPGGGIALDQHGKPDGQGAIQMNIPVAYTPGANYFSVGVFEGEHVDAYYKDTESNGSGVFAFGIGNWPRFYGSAMAVSHLFANDSKAISLQLQCVEETSNMPAIAIGVQDPFRKEWVEFHNTMNSNEGYFFVATKRFSIKHKPLYTTLGYGTGRFLSRPFVGLSYPLSDQLNIIGEFDGYQLNGGIGFRPFGRYGSFTMLAGYNGKCGKLIGSSYAGKGNSAWAVPIGLYLLYCE
jgi:hypothetical protein